MKSIGGYFELLLNTAGEWHNNATRLNTARNALEYILLANQFHKVYLPYYCCDALIEPLEKHQIPYSFYSIDDSFFPKIDWTSIEQDAGFVYVNYFGVCDSVVDFIVKKVPTTIIDNSQSFFSTPIVGVNTFYSARKFFGVPDGSYLYSTKSLLTPIEQDFSASRSEHLLGRLESGPELFFSSYTKNELELCNQPIKQMSVLTQYLLNAIPYKEVISTRKRNFEFLHRHLGTQNKLTLGAGGFCVPMVYPFLTDNNYLREKLHENKIYVAQYWQEVVNKCSTDSLEYRLSKFLLPLPIDQRYNQTDMEFILSIIKEKFKK